MDEGTTLMRALGAAGGALLVALLALPIAVLALTVSADDLAAASAHGLGEAVRVSLGASAVATLLVALGGTPLAWWLGRGAGARHAAIEALVRLPAIAPPAVAGVALLVALGPDGPLEHALAAYDARVPGTASAVVLSQVWVAAPFYVLPLAGAFRGVDDETLWAARSVGASGARVFFRVALPLARPALLAALAMAWARAVGELGATLIFAGDVAGVTRTLPLAVLRAAGDGLGPARATALVLFALALAPFLLVRLAPLARALGARR
ncbi:MAG: ABC transporter permease subunit [Sandaracinaceae bacterium]|nr:ABC transporter permease subunit [Sandaracinaceae bacterium]